MSEENMEGIRAVFLAARGLPPDERRAYLDEACEGDAARRREVERLLHVDLTETLAVPDTVTLPDGKAAPINEPAAPSLPRRIGPYFIISLIGEGGMGEVYKAEQKTPIHRFAALKVVKSGVNSKAVISRFQSERRALALMDHPNIAKVYDAGMTDSGQPYFAMEFVDGQPITQFADENKLTIRQRLQLFQQVCEAIDHAHKKLIIHRDIKASNVLAYMQDGRPAVKVIDFGIAKALSDESAAAQTLLTMAGSVIGTYEYMSPEQAAGSPDIDTRTDVYSLGVLLYELLTGARPFESKTLRRVAEQEIRRMIREVEPPRPSTRLSGLGEDATTVVESRRMSVHALVKQLRSELEWIPLKAIRKEPERRYASPLELADDIGNYLESRPLIAGPETNAYKLKKFIAKRKVPVFAGAAVAAALVAGIIGTTIGFMGQRKLRLQSDANAQRAGREETQARANASRADANAKLATQNARDAELRLAQSLVSQGDSLTAADRPADACDVYRDAYGKFKELNTSSLSAEVGLCLAQAASPPPLITLRGHAERIKCVALGPDGRIALSGGEDKMIKLWDLTSGREIRTLRGNAVTLRGNNRQVYTIAFCPDGRTAVSGGNDNTVKVWDLRNGEEIKTLRGHTQRVISVAVSPDGRAVLSASWDQTIRLWDLATAKERRTFQSKAGQTQMASVAFSPDGQTALFAGGNILAFWDVATGKELQSLPEPQGPTCAVFTPDGRGALTGLLDGTIDLWDLATGKIIKSLKGHQGPVLSVAISPDGRTAISGSFDGTLKWWDLASGNAILSFQGHAGLIEGVAFSPDGRTALTGGIDKTLKLWQLATDKEVRALRGHLAVVTSVAISPAGRIALSGSEDTTLKLWDISTGREIRTLRGYSQSIDGAALSPNGRAALSVGDGDTVKLWDLATGTDIRTLKANAGGTMGSVVFGPDGRSALTGGTSPTLKLWDLATGAEIRSVNSVDKRDGLRVAISPDGRTALTGGTNAALKWWDLMAGAQLRILHGGTTIVFGVAFSPDGKTALSANGEGTLTWVDLATGKELQALRSHTSWQLTSVAFGPDGSTALTGGADGTARLWDLRGGKEIQVLRGHAGGVYSVAFFPNGRGALSGSYDGMIKIWDFSRATRYMEFDRTVPEATATLARRPDDPAALKTLGDWFAFRNRDDWAVEFLEKARTGGVSVDALTLAGLYWELANDLPPMSKLTQEACLTAAGNEYARALAQSKDENERFHLGLCADAVRRASALLSRTSQP